MSRPRSSSSRPPPTCRPARRDRALPPGAVARRRAAYGGRLGARRRAAGRGDALDPVPRSRVPRGAAASGCRSTSRTPRRRRVPAGQDVEELIEDGAVVGRLVRTRWTLARHGDGHATARRSTPRLAIVRIGVGTTPPGPGEVEPGWAPRDVAARSSFVGTHLLLTVARGRVRLVARRAGVGETLDALELPAAAVLAGAGRRRRRHRRGAGLADHPRRLPARSRPESAGDLFDATEIDEILTLRVMTMTERGEGGGPRHRPAGGGDPRPLRRDDRPTAWTGCTARRRRR